MRSFLYRFCQYLVRISIALAALLLSVSSKAQENAIKFNLVEGIGEISLGKITGITQDTNGYMWFSDQDKSCITRYDGYSMRSYRYDMSNPGGLGGSYPETIYADPRVLYGLVFTGWGWTGLTRARKNLFTTAVIPGMPAGSAAIR